MKRTILKILLVFILLIIYTYIIAIQTIPNDIVVFQGETIRIKTILGLNANFTDTDNVIEAISNSQTKKMESVGKTKVSLNLFENIFLKDINVDVLPQTTVIPVGNVAGIKLYTSGVLVVGMSEIEGLDNKKYKPYENTGIEEGDTIVSVNDNKIESTQELVECVNLSNGSNVKLEYVHNNKTLECSIKPVKTSSKEYKLGLWVRDSAARCRNCYIL